jgi:DNA-binding transcriptional MocR family regulator
MRNGLPTFQLDKNSDLPLYAQLRDALVGQIQSGSLKPGDRLGTVTGLAKQLGVTPTTVRRAYEELSAMGLIESHVGRGTFVGQPNAAPPSPTEPKALPSLSPDTAMAARRMRMGVAQSLETLQAMAARPGLIHFTHGAPAASTLRENILADLTRKVLAKDPDACVNYSIPPGLVELRQAVAQHYTRTGTAISPDQVLITSGSQQAVTLLALSAKENHRKILCEMPCYMGIAKSFGAMGHWVESVIRDEEGPLPDQLEAHTGGPPAMLYLCPEMHNPMGTDLSTQRREFLIAWAKRTNTTIIADEIFRDLRFTATSPPSLLSEAGTENTVVLGSLSKSFAPGLRIGWLISSPQRIKSLGELKRAMDLGCPALMQKIAAELMTSGEYEDHIRRVRKLYEIRRDTTLRALKQHMSEGVTWTRPTGGFHLWMRLPEGYSSLALFMLGVENGVAITPGPMHDIDHRFINAARVSYGSLRPEQINDGIERLATATKELMKHPPSEPGLSGMGALV